MEKFQFVAHIKDFNSYIKKYKAVLIAKRKQRGFTNDLSNPITIQDKIHWLQLYDNTNELKTFCADKVKVHEYVKEKLGKDICVPILKIYNNVNEIDWNELPNQFVMKCNHGSGYNIICKDKSKLNISECKQKLNKWMNTSYGETGGRTEWHYNEIERKIFVEKYLFDNRQLNSLYDYKFWCFNGEPLLYTINDGFGHGNILYYSVKDDSVNDFYKVGNNSHYRKPKNFEMMKMYAKKLSEDFKFVRVDFYQVNGKVYIGEMTFTPGGGLFCYKNKSDEIRIGRLVNLN